MKTIEDLRLVRELASAVGIWFNRRNELDKKKFPEVEADTYQFKFEDDCIVIYAENLENADCEFNADDMSFHIKDVDYVEFKRFKLNKRVSNLLSSQDGKAVFNLNLAKNLQKIYCEGMTIENFLDVDLDWTRAEVIEDKILIAHQLEDIVPDVEFYDESSFKI